MMIEPMLGVVGTAFIAVVAAVVGAVALYLVFRNNPKVKAKVDSKVDEIDSKTKF